MDTYQILDLILSVCSLVLLWAVYKHWPRDKKPTVWHKNLSVSNTLEGLS